MGCCAVSGRSGIFWPDFGSVLQGFSEKAIPQRQCACTTFRTGFLGNCRSRRLSACSGNECWRGLARLEDEIVEPGAFTRGELGDHLSSVGERERAASAYLQAIESAQRAVNERPQDMELRRELADCYERLGQFHIRTREWSPAGDWYAKSLEVWATWTRWGVSSVYNVRRQQQAAAWMARCDTALKQRRGDTFFFFFRLRS
jgi:tetratricopeptide (TPR) repeat protein